MRSLSIALLALLGLPGCSPSVEPLVVTGSSTIAPVMQEVAEAYERDTGLRVDVQSGGSGRGIQDALSGMAHLGMASRNLKQDERDAGLINHVIAHDGIVLIVNKQNPVTALDSDHVRDIYTGVQSDWEAYGGHGPITVINKAEGRATLDLFLEYFGLDNRNIQADLVAGENQQVLKAVASDKNAIGYLSIGTAEYEATQGVPIRLLLLDGHQPSVAALRRGDYPLSRQLNLVTAGAPSDSAQQLLEYVYSDAMAKVIESHYFVPATRKP